ncbi:hypothetical protein Hdeb2414_s0011g00372051 [Helianthus debilis subsp. tardiflorus]
MKIGDHKLYVNVAKFAAENSGLPDRPVSHNVQSNSSGLGLKHGFNFRDGRSYSDVLGKPFGKGISSSGSREYSGDGAYSVEKSVVIPDRISALSDKYGSVVIGKTVDLETLVDMDKLLRIAKLEAWGGQTLPMERVAWLSLHGIPVNLLDHVVLGQIGELFGKVLFAPIDLGVDSDLSVFKIGVLAGEVQRIREVVSLKWRDRTFRIWVDEDQDA